MGQNKETTYQRLKRENQELKQKIMILACAPESEEGTKIIMDVRTRKDIEAAIWAGDVGNQKFDGLIKQIVYEGDVLNESDIT